MSLNGDGHSENPGLDGKIILKLILMKQDGNCDFDCTDSGWGRMAKSCKDGYENLSSTEDG
jgi:hypothetical protein